MHNLSVYVAKMGSVLWQGSCEKKKQIDRNHTQEGIGHNFYRAKESGGGMTRHRTWKENVVITITKNWSREGWNTQNGNHIVTVI
jgi:hypothetical protein